MDIGSKSKWPANKLSNFALSLFEIDGVQCASVEGFIQALKKKNPEIQKYGCTLIGLKAKYWGKGVKWWQRSPKEQLWWMGKSFPCHSEEHLKLVYRALKCKFTQCESSKRALLATRDAVLTHSIGRDNNTSLRASDFCKMLTRIREEIKQKGDTE